MKRREMIDIMLAAYEEYIAPIKEICPDYKMPTLAPSDVGFILMKMEQAGMKPPCLEEAKCQALMQVYYAGYSFNQWDEEFEKDEKVVSAYRRNLLRKEE